jgi:ADP-heptose:LPS heptosyltransferase
MKISVVIGGGVGDMILSTRFLAATREKYPSARISVYCNDKGLENHSEFIQAHWGGYFDNFSRIEMIDENFKISSQFGVETYNEAYLNIKKSIRKEIESADKYYCFRPDSLEYLDYRDIPWTKYIRCIPSPQNIHSYQGSLPEDFVVLNLYAREGHYSAVTKEYSDSLIEVVKRQNNVVILAPSDEVRDTFYSSYKQDVIVATLDECLAIIEKSRIGVSIDTGLRCLFHAFGKSCYTLCRMCPQFFSPPQSHWLRWYPWTENMLPINPSPASVRDLVENSKLGIASELFPTVQPQDMDRVLIRRRYD